MVSLKVGDLVAGKDYNEVLLKADRLDLDEVVVSVVELAAKMVFSKVSQKVAVKVDRLVGVSVVHLVEQMVDWRDKETYSRKCTSS